jgi:hypothetical protein
MRKIVLFLLIVILLAVAVHECTTPAQAAPDGFNIRAAVGCSVVYYTGGEFYKLTVEGMSLALGVPTIPYQLDQLVFGKWTGVGGGFVQPGVGQPENQTFPAVSYVNTGAVQLFSLSKTFQGMTCPVYIPIVKVG